MAWYYDPEDNTVKEAETPPHGYAPFETKAAALRWAWVNLKNARDLYVDKEREIRDNLVKELMPDYEEGTHHFDNLTITLSYAYKVEHPENIPADLASRVLTWKPSLSVSGLKKCNDEEKSIIAQAVSCKWNAPQVKIKED